MCEKCDVHPGGGVMDKTEIILWWDSLYEVLLYNVDEDEHRFAMEWSKVLLEELDALR